MGDWNQKNDKDFKKTGITKPTQKDIYMKTLEFAADENWSNEMQESSFTKFAKENMKYDKIQDKYRKAFGSAMNDFKLHDVTSMEEHTRKKKKVNSDKKSPATRLITKKASFMLPSKYH